MNTSTKAIQELATVIETSLAKLDIKGNDDQISRAMCIVRDAFTSLAEPHKVSPSQLVNQALERFPVE